LSSCFGCCDGADGADVTDNGEHQLSRQPEREPKRSGGRVQPIVTCARSKTDVPSPRASPVLLSRPGRAAAALGASAAACACLAHEDARTEVYPFQSSPWLVIRLALPDMRLRWIQKETGVLSWAQPLPQLVPLRNCDYLHTRTGAIAFAVAEDFEGAPVSELNPAARTGISGKAPDQDRLRRWVRARSLRKRKGSRLEM
jgi:hypothetical protein